MCDVTMPGITVFIYAHVPKRKGYIIKDLSFSRVGHLNYTHLLSYSLNDKKVVSFLDVCQICCTTHESILQILAIASAKSDPK